MGVQELVEVSRRYGGDHDYVLAGGGNTSYKEGQTLYVKASGTTLASLSEEGLVRMDRSRLSEIWRREYSTDTDQREREALADLMAARGAGETKRPSVETLLHDLLEQQYVVHLHPALVNGLTCGATGQQIAAELFPTATLWIPVVNPGYVLARHIREAIEASVAAGNPYPNTIFLENHGVFVAADSVDAVDRRYREIMEALRLRLVREPDMTPGSESSSLGQVAARVEQTLATRGIEAVHAELTNTEVVRAVASAANFEPLRHFGYTPDHLVYCKAAPVWIPADRREDQGYIREEVASFEGRYRALPRIFAVEGQGIIAAGDSRAQVDNAAQLLLDLLRIVVYAESFGGPKAMPQDKIDFILNWEVESYRAKVGQDGA